MSVQRIRFTEETDGIFREKLKKGKLETSLKKIRETGSIDQRHENGRRKHARTEENVTAADELVLGQGDGRLYTETSFNMLDISHTGGQIQTDASNTV